MTGYLFVYILKKVKQQTKNIKNFSGDFSITELKKTDLTFVGLGQSYNLSLICINFNLYRENE